MKYSISIRANFEKRLSCLEDNYDRMMTEDYNKTIIQLGETLSNIDETKFWSVFRDCGGSLHKLEDLELFLSFVGNFNDDSYFQLKEDMEIRRITESAYEAMDNALGKRDHPEVIPVYYIIWGSDYDETYLRWQDMVDFLTSTIRNEITDQRKRARRIIKLDMANEDSDIVFAQLKLVNEYIDSWTTEKHELVGDVSDSNVTDEFLKQLETSYVNVKNWSEQRRKRLDHIFKNAFSTNEYVNEFVENFVKNQRPLDSVAAQILNDNFWDFV